MSSKSAKSTEPNVPALDRLKSQLAQVDALIAEGVLSGDAARQAREKLEKQVLAAVLSAPAAPAAGAAMPAAVVATPRPPMGLTLAVAAFVLVIGAAGYAWRGNHDGLNVAPGDTAAAPADAAAPHATGNAEMEALVGRLAERLKAQPDDPEGWSMLGRTYSSQGKFAEALPAFKRVVELRPKDAQALADYADALAVMNNRTIDGEPEKLVLKALTLDPANVKALSLAGTASFNRGDYNGASGLWERAVKASDPGSEFTKQLQSALNEARQRAGLPPLAEAPAAVPASPVDALTQAAAAPPPPAPAQATTAAPAAATPAGNAQASVSGRVTLGAAAKGQVSPDDTVFIFARAPTGSRMPLALLRKKVSDLPLDFHLDDTLSMSPAALLSGAPKVVVGARVSKSGSAVPGPGDWQALSAPVALGAQGLRLEIAEPAR